MHQIFQQTPFFLHIFSVSSLPYSPVYIIRCPCCSLWTWWLRQQPDVCSATPTPTTSTPSLSILTFRLSSPLMISGWTCGTWRSLIAASVTFLRTMILSEPWFVNNFRSALQSACYIFKINDGFFESSLVPFSQTLWTSSQQTWRSWQKWSPQQSFIPSSVRPLPTAAARARYACVTWDRLHSVTSTANVSTCCTRVWKRYWMFMGFLPCEYCIVCVIQYFILILR